MEDYAMKIQKEQKKRYESPAIEVFKLAIVQPLLTVSGSDFSNFDTGGLPVPGISFGGADLNPLGEYGD